jgi:DNA-binding NarL/FixJ family response regulator
MDELQHISVHPDLILCDLSEPTLGTLKAIKAVQASGIISDKVPIIAISRLRERTVHLEARRLGCDDYMAIPIDFEVFTEIICKHLKRANYAELTGNPGFELTPREVQTLALVARGKLSGEIANLLGLSERTVNFHVDNAIRKIGASTRSEAAFIASRYGVI